MSRPRLIVCTTCRAGRPLAEGETPPGAALHAEIARLLSFTPHPTPPPQGGRELSSPPPLVGGGREEGSDRIAPPIDLLPVACMANCERGCSAALAMPGKWTIFLGHLTPAHAADLLSYAATYAAHPTGTVMPSRRPASLRDVVLARIPHLEFVA